MSAAHMNRATLIGNVGRDPESRTFNNGGRVVSFSMATTNRWKDKASGEFKENTTWHSICIFNDHLAGVALQHVIKGSLVMVEGEIQVRKWKDKEGTDRYTTEIVLTKFAGTLKLLGERNKSGGGQSSQQDGGGRSDPANGDPPAGLDDDEIPW